MDKKTDQTDLTFFTNEYGYSLLSRFKSTLKDTQLFDVLVGYFRYSGFYQLYEALEPVEKIRILVGLNIDKKSYDVIQHNRQIGNLDLESHKRTKKIFQENLQDEIETSDEDDNKLEIGVRKFIEFLERECKNNEVDKTNGGNGKQLEIRAYPSKNIHAKVYIGKFKPEDRDYGFVITGSSNFSESGLIANREFNVELRTKSDVLFAENQFDKLWAESVDISVDFIDTITTKTWLNSQITPYELYLKLIYEYLEEDINLEDHFDSYLPEGFMKLRYQEQAAIQAKKILETYNGVFLADVVGLGKTFITTLLLQKIRGKTLIVCPPVLKKYWKDSLFDFKISSFEVESLGKLERIVKEDLNKYDYVVIDEAHRFRNDETQSYANLLDICRGKKVILVTATPINNTVDDIFSQLKLFQAPKNSTIPGVPNLEKFFSAFRTQLNKIDKADPEYKVAIKEMSNKIKNSILRYVMVRRTRKDVVTYFQEDIVKQKLKFPDLSTPQKIVYEYKGDLEITFNKTIQYLQEFTYARYTPLLYYIGNKRLTEFEKQQQRNVGGFMKSLLVKRLESSFYAFKQSVNRFIMSYKKFIDMFNDGTVYIGSKVDVYDLLDNDDFEKLESLISEEEVYKYDSKDFKKEFIKKLEIDLKILKDIQAEWKNIHSDPKLEKFISELKTNKTLKKNKLIIFTESKETGDYIFEALLKEFPSKVLFYYSKGGRHTDKTTMSNRSMSRDMIQANFDPNKKKQDQKNDLQILIATDVLAEGVNLHRSNVIVNYDLPWNPTRVLQRVGRVNRLGSNFDKVHIFNFFPTTHSDEHMGLKVNITNKIQMFHDILGEDAKYLSDGEEFGSQELFDTLNSKKTYSDDDDEGDSELKYLEMMRKIRDENPELFEKIKKLPKKARSGFKNKEITNDLLVTFFRIGKLKKFYLNESGKSNEITFFDAVNKLECTPTTKKTKIPNDYFDILKINKSKFETDSKTADEPSKSSSARSNAAYIERRLKDKVFNNRKGFTDIDDEFIAKVKNMLNNGTMAKIVAKNIKKEFKKTTSPLELLKILRNHICIESIEQGSNSKKEIKKREVILSGYIIR